MLTTYNLRPDLADALEAAAARPDFLAAIRELYAQADASAAASGLVCLGGGCCCKFDIAGHRLYLSTGELAILAATPRPARPAVDAAAPSTPPRLRCPYQRGPRCHARDNRPLGCRIHFCRGDHAALNARYEQLHDALRHLHDQFGVPYYYVELTASLGTQEPGQ